MSERPRFMLFIWSEWDTDSGGSRSLNGSFDTFAAAREVWASMKEDHGQVLDLDTGVWHDLVAGTSGQIPRVLMDDVVRDDHTRMRITRICDRHPGPGTWNVMAGNADEEGGVSFHFIVIRLPALDKNGRRAWSPCDDTGQAVG